jgi:hypothetical protein
MNARVLSLVLALLIAVPALAGEEKKKDDEKKTEKVKVASTKEYKKELEIFERDFDTVDIDYKLQALKRFAKCVHKDVTQKLLKIVMRDKDPHVRAEAAKGLMYQVPFAKTIGPRAQALIEDDKEDPKVLAALVYTLGVLEYTKAWEEIADLIGHEDDKVVIACFWTFGEWKELRAWRDFQNFWDMYPEEGKWATGTVKVDTGAAGTADADAAKAKWKAKYGNAAKLRPRPDCVKALKEAVEKITGKKIEKPDDWREWCKENKRLLKAAKKKRD